MKSSLILLFLLFLSEDLLMAQSKKTKKKPTPVQLPLLKPSLFVYSEDMNERKPDTLKIYKRSTAIGDFCQIQCSVTIESSISPFTYDLLKGKQNMQINETAFRMPKSFSSFAAQLKYQP